MKRAAITAMMITALVLPLWGCVATGGGTSSRDINDLKQSSYQARKDIAENTRAIRALEQALGDMPRESSLGAIRQSQTSLLDRVNSLHEEVQAMMQTVENDLAKSKQLSQETAASLDVLKASAGQGGEVAARLNAIEAELALIKKKLELKSSVGAPSQNDEEESAGGTAKDKAEADYKAAYGAYKDEKYDKARAMFEAFLKEHGAHKWAGNAQFWIGETYFSRGQYEKAILAYHDVTEKYSGSNKVADAMLKKGYAFIKLNDPLAAKGVLGELIQKHPDSKAAEYARQKLKELR